MTYKKLLAKGLIKSFKAEPSQIKDQLVIAHRDLKAAHEMMGKDNDWAYSIAYNALLQAARALMFREGYRPGGEGQHKTAIMFAQIALGREFEDEIRFFDKMRIKRNQVVYDIAGLVSEEEAKQALEFAIKFIDRIQEELEEK